MSWNPGAIALLCVFEIRETTAMLVLEQIVSIPLVTTQVHSGANDEQITLAPTSQLSSCA